MKVVVVTLAVLVVLLIGCVLSIVTHMLTMMDKFNSAIYEIEREQKRVDHVLDWVRDVIKKNQLS